MSFGHLRVLGLLSHTKCCCAPPAYCTLTFMAIIKWTIDLLFTCKHERNVCPFWKYLLHVWELYSGHTCCGWLFYTTGPSKQDSFNYHQHGGKIQCGRKSENCQRGVHLIMTLCQIARQSQVGFSYIKMSIWVSFIHKYPWVKDQSG